MSYAFTLNGQCVDIDVPGLTPLLTVLRDHVGFTGAKSGCGEGRCGACTVLIEDQPVVSCLLPVATAEGRAVRTVESLAGVSDPLSFVQDALLDAGGVQCGACIPGMVMTLTALLEQERDDLSEQTVRQSLTGNICRCTGYQKIVDAALLAARSGGGQR